MTHPWHRIDSYWLKMVKEFLVPELPTELLAGEFQPRVAAILAAIQENKPVSAVASAAALLPLVRDCSDLSALVLAFKAIGELQLNAFDSSLASLMEASSHRPHDSRLLYSTGLVMLRRGDVDAAAEFFEQATLHDETLGQAWAALAIIRALEQDHARCEHASRQALDNGVELDGKLVRLALMQSTYRLGKPVEGACDFSVLGQESQAVIEHLLPLFPPVSQEAFVHPDDGRPIIFLYADHTYVVEHAVALVLSISATHSHCRIHLHVANPGRHLQSLLQRLSVVVSGIPLVVSTETVPAKQFASPGVYFSCMRFVRFHQLLECNKQPVILLDVDLLARKNPLELLDDYPGVDVVLAEAEFDPLWGRFFAGAVAIRPTTGGLAFARQVASLILTNLHKQTGRWFLDQIALAVCYDQCRERVRFATVSKPKVASRTFNASAFFSSVVNEQKQADNGHNRFKRELLEQARLPDVREERPYVVDQIATPNGTMLVDARDAYIGMSIRTRGSWCPHEIELLAMFLAPGQTVVDGGANIGSHTIPLARQVGPAGRVYAFEPQRLVFQILAGNLAINGLTNVFAIPKGLGAKPAVMHVGQPQGGNNLGAVRLLESNDGTLETSDVMPLDDLDLDACHLIKLDCERMEGVAIEGARQTISRHRPILYVENHEDEGDSPLIRQIDALGYQMFWHGVETRNPNMLCMPKESQLEVRGLRRVQL